MEAPLSPAGNMLGHDLAHHPQELHSVSCCSLDAGFRHGAGHARNPPLGHLLTKFLADTREVTIDHPALQVDREDEFAAGNSVEM
jgi:hypothetical protein